MGKLLYNIGIRSYYLAIILVSPFNQKAKSWFKGRRLQRIENHEGSIWFHCASLGEFEQAKPVIETIKQLNRDQKIILTFFSPSGYTQRKSYELAEAVYYLPLDTRTNATKFVRTVQPKAAIFVKYEVWHHYFSTLKTREIPLFLISATFRKDQVYFRQSGNFLRNTLKLCTLICVQDQTSLELLQSYGFDNAIFSGDTRYDRVLNQREENNQNTRIEQFKGDALMVLIGSSWPEEEALVAEFIENQNKANVKYLIAPHQVQKQNINRITKELSHESIRYTKPSEKEAQIMILDTIGHLSSAYQYADIALVGGGFSNALHNILEPATFGIPVLYGNNHPKFPEGAKLKTAGGGFPVSRAEFADVLIELIDNEAKRVESGENAKRFIEKNAGATPLIISKISDHL